MRLVFVLFFGCYFEKNTYYMKWCPCKKGWYFRRPRKGTNLFLFPLKTVIVQVLMQFLVCPSQCCAISNYWNRRRWRLFKVNQQLLHGPYSGTGELVLWSGVGDGQATETSQFQADCVLQENKPPPPPPTDLISHGNIFMAFFCFKTVKQSCITQT